MRPLFAAMTTLLAAFAGAQSVRHLDASPSFPRSTYRQAQREGRSWPNLSDGDDCTIVDLGSDDDDADLTVVSTVSEERLFVAVRSAVTAIGPLRVDYGRRHGDAAATVRASFRDDLRHEGRDTRFTFPIARLLEGLKRAKLPGPLVVAVERRSGTAVLAGSHGRQPLTKDVTLFASDELASYDTLETDFHVETWATLAAGLALLLGGGMFVAFPAFLLWATRTKPSIDSPTPPPTPAEVQAKYDALAAKPRWRQGLLLAPFLTILFVPPLLMSKVVAAQIGAVMPQAIKNAVSLPWIFLIFLPFVSALLVIEWRGRHEARREHPEGRAPLPLVTTMLIFVGGMAGLLVLLRGPLRTLPAEYRLTALLSLPFVVSVTLLFLLYRNSRCQNRPLPADDPVAIVAKSLGRQAKVKVRRVVERGEGGPNAFATLFGTVGITRKLRETLDADEIRAVMAHEVGHLKASDPWRFLGFGLPPILALDALWFWLDAHTPYGDSPFFRFGMQATAVLGPTLLSAYFVSPRRRKAEHAADLFALEQTGDVELVSRALVKIHDANLAPHRLHPRDERVASHPALERRLERLREAADVLSTNGRRHK